jgi:hypothetical protein
MNKLTPLPYEKLYLTRSMLCPHCEVINKHKAEKLKAEATLKYGVVDVERFFELWNESERKSWHYSLLEEQDSWMDKDGLVRIHYKATCDVCNLDYLYEYEEQIPMDKLEE